MGPVYKGIQLFDSDNNAYYDTVSSWWCNILGHSHPKVVDAMHDAMRFWLDKGVSGFRVDAFAYMLESPTFADEPENPDWKAGGPVSDAYNRNLHTMTENLDGLHEILQGMQSVLQEYGKGRFMVGEIYQNKQISEIRPSAWARLGPRSRAGAARTARARPRASTATSSARTRRAGTRGRTSARRSSTRARRSSTRSSASSAASAPPRPWSATRRRRPSSSRGSAGRSPTCTLASAPRSRTWTIWTARPPTTTARSC